MLRPGRPASRGVRLRLAPTGSNFTPSCLPTLYGDLAESQRRLPTSTTAVHMNDLTCPPARATPPPNDSPGTYRHAFDNRIPTYQQGSEKGGSSFVVSSKRSWFVLGVGELVRSVGFGRRIAGLLFRNRKVPELSPRKAQILCLEGLKRATSSPIRPEKSHVLPPSGFLDFSPCTGTRRGRANKVVVVSSR